MSRVFSLPYRKVSNKNNLDFDKDALDALISLLARYNVSKPKSISYSLRELINDNSLIAFIDLIVATCESNRESLIFLTAKCWITQLPAPLLSFRSSLRNCKSTEGEEHLERLAHASSKNNYEKYYQILKEELFYEDEEIPDIDKWIDNPSKIVSYLDNYNYDIAEAIEELYVGEVYKFLESIITIETGFEIRETVEEDETLKSVINTSLHIIKPGYNK